MGISIKKQDNSIPKTLRGHSKSLPLTISLDFPWRLRAGHLQTLFSVSNATLYVRIKSGEIPPPDGKDGGRPFWKSETIKRVLTG